MAVELEGQIPSVGLAVQPGAVGSNPCGQTSVQLLLLRVEPAAQIGLKTPEQLAFSAMAAGKGPQLALLMGTSTPTLMSTTDACTS
jgi:hypothetical protein